MSKNTYIVVAGQCCSRNIEKTGSLKQTYPYPVQAWQLGNDLTWIALGGEVVVDYSVRLKKELGKVWVTGYANDVMAYIPSLRVLKEGGYEGDTAMIYYGLPTAWGPRVEEAIIGEVHARRGCGSRCFRLSVSWNTILISQDLRGYLMSRPWATFLIFTFLFTQTAFAQPPVRKFDDPGSPPFKVLKTGENPPLDADGNFVIGPEYKPAPERKVVEGVPQGKVKQFTIDSKETKLFNPGIARKVFGKVDPKNPKTLIVETHTIDYKRQITVYIPAQYVAGTEAPFMVVPRRPHGQTEHGAAADSRQPDRAEARAADDRHHGRQRRRRCPGARARQGI